MCAQSVVLLGSPRIESAVYRTGTEILSMTVSAVSYAVKRGEEIAKRNKYRLGV